MTERLAGIQVQEEAGSAQSIAESPTAITAFVGRCLRGPVEPAGPRLRVQRIPAHLRRPVAAVDAVLCGRAVLRERRPHGGHRARHERRALLHAAPAGGRTGARAAGAGARHARVPARRGRLRRHRRQRGGLLQPRDPARAHAGLGAHRGPGDLPPRFDRPGRAALGRGRARGIGARARRGRTAAAASRPDAAPRPARHRRLCASPARMRTTARRSRTTTSSVRPRGAPGSSRSTRATDSTCSASRRSRATSTSARARCSSRTAICRERRAILFVDPPLAWDSAAKALAEMRHWPLPSDSACMFFPRLLGYDKLRGRFEAFAPSGAIAGTLSRASEHWPVWTSACGEDAVVRPGSGPPAPWMTSTATGWRRSASTRCRPCAGRDARARRPARSQAPARWSADWRSLSARRLALLVVNSIERGTRWMVFEPNEPPTWRRAAQQLREFLAALEERGAFAHRETGDRWFVVCDERVNLATASRAGHREPDVRDPGTAAGRFPRLARQPSRRAAAACRPSARISPGCRTSGLTQVLAELEVPAVDGI